MTWADPGVLAAGLLCGLGFAAASVLWRLLVAPDEALSWLDRRAPTDDGEAVEPLAWPLRWSLAAVVLLSGFLAGAAMGFVARAGI